MENEDVDCLGWDVLLSMKRVPKIGLTSYDAKKRECSP